MVIALFAYMDALVCRHVIVVVSMLYGYSLLLLDSVKICIKEGLKSPIISCVTMKVIETLVTCDERNTTFGNVVETNI